MKKIIYLFIFWVLLLSCKNKTNNALQTHTIKNEIRYASGLSIQNYNKFTLITIKNTWPKAIKKYNYVLAKKGIKIPDSLVDYQKIQIPIKRIVVTSTTHIPSLEMLDEEKSLVGFPNLNYISSPKVRRLIELNKITELGSNQNINTEVLLNLQPQLIVGYGLDNNNTALENIQKSGLQLILNGDWNEQTPLGKAEWIKLFGALYNKQKKANELFAKIENNYLKTIAIAQKAQKTPSVLLGDIFEGTWYLPSGTSWGSLMLKQANANYLWANTKGTGSLALSLEKVLIQGKNADFWITSGQFSTLQQMQNANIHYNQFKAFKTKNVYSFAAKKGKTGGVLYYELAPNRPDIVIKDLVKIMHPELLKGYKPFFFEKLK